MRKKKLYDGQTIKEWKNALSLVTGISGFVLEEGPRGENELLNKLVKSVFYDFGDGPRHQVFINHRGEVKENFARPLYNRLVSSGLKVFLDEPEMVRGLWIASQLEVGIQCAPVTIAVFSPKYAQSRWCLEELSLTVRSGNTIIPVFYGVERSDLQCPENGVYAKDLLNHKNKHPYDSETPQKWRDALSEVAKLPGYELDGNKEDLLDKIVQRVKKDLTKRSMVVESSQEQNVLKSLKSLKSLFMEDVPKQSENFPAGKQFESDEDNGPSFYILFSLLMELEISTFLTYLMTNITGRYYSLRHISHLWEDILLYIILLLLTWLLFILGYTFSDTTVAIQQQLILFLLRFTSIYNPKANINLL